MSDIKKFGGRDVRRWQNARYRRLLMDTAEAPAATGDPYWPSVKLLLEMEGTDDATTFTDSGPNSEGMTSNGAVTSIDQQKFGTSSMFTDSLGDYLEADNTDILTDDQASFTIEAFIRLNGQNFVGPSVSAGAGSHMIVAQPKNQGSGEQHFAVVESSRLLYWYRSNFILGGTYSVFGTTPLVDDRWYHVALTYDADTTTMRMFLDGDVEATQTSVANGGWGNSTTTAAMTPFRVGTSLTPSYGGYQQTFNGYIDELRVTQGVARYTEAFTVPTEAYPQEISDDETTDPYWDNVSLLLPFEGTDGGTDATDQSSNAHGLTWMDNAQLSNTDPKFGSGTCLLLDGSGDAVYVTSHSTTLTPESGSFTAEAHIKVDRTTGSTMRIMGVYYATGTNKEWLFGYNPTANTLGINFSDQGTIDRGCSSETWNPTIGQWYHVAMVFDRDGATDVSRVFVDGVQLGSDDNTIDSYPTINEGGQILGIGRFWAGTQDYFEGQIDNVRITKGVARYKEDFTPPTVAYPTSA